MDAKSLWKYEDIRSCNYFIDLVTQRLKKNELIGSPTNIKHYLGEIYFFRAYTYYKKLRAYGDLPLVDEVLKDKFEELIKLSKRTPQNEVARFIISDLKEAAGLLLETAPGNGRISKDAALMLLARVALYEGTWLKYHGGTGLAPGNPKWPGNKYFPNFAFQAGDITAEANFFFDEAIKASEIIADKRPLHKKYQELFSSLSLAGIPEVILAKNYSSTVNGHSVSQRLARTADGTGFTRSLIDSYLMEDGLPYYKSPKFESDTSIITVMAHRDSRLVTSTNIPGQISTINKATNDTAFVGLPRITGRSYNSNTPTGYEIAKWRSVDYSQSMTESAGTTASPIFRAAEAYCIYLEAYYERHNALGGKCATYWKQLRERAGVNPDFEKTIRETDLSKEIDLGRYSGTKLVSS
ncbi:MAG: RagB/SusD family nutrient uptake outer membrane protein, partial [Bacteroidaceae bacterium]